MANDGNRIYINTATDPDVGVSLDDIGTVLVRSVRDDGQLCGDVAWNSTTQQWEVVNGGAGAINMWAKNKPFRNSTIGFSKAEVMASSGAFVNAQKIANYGLECAVINSQGQVVDSGVFDNFGGFDNAGVEIVNSDNCGDDYQDYFLYKLITGQLGWVYNRPRGKSQSYDERFRVLDFHNYYHDVTNPMPEAVSRTGSWTLPSSGSVTIQLARNVVATGGLNLSDLHAVVSSQMPIASDMLNNWYPGVVLYYRDTQNNYHAHYKTADHVVSYYGVDDTIDIELTNITSGTWYARSFLSDIQITENQVIPQQGTYIPAGNIAREYSFVLTGGVITVTKLEVKCLAATGLSDVKAVITFTNQGVGATVSNAYLIIYDDVIPSQYPLAQDPQGNGLNGHYASNDYKTYSNNNLESDPNHKFNRGTTFRVVADVLDDFNNPYEISEYGTII